MDIHFLPQSENFIGIFCRLRLSTARRQFDHWRSQQPNKRTRLPKALWQQAVALAKEHGLNKTAHALNVKYYSIDL